MAKCTKVLSPHTELRKIQMLISNTIPGQDANEKLQPSDPSYDSFQGKDVNSIATLQMKGFKTPFIYFFNLFFKFFNYSYLITKMFIM